MSQVLLPYDTGKRIEKWLYLYQSVDTGWAEKLISNLKNTQQSHGYLVSNDLLDQIKTHLDLQAKEGDYWAIDILRTLN